VKIRFRTKDKNRIITFAHDETIKKRSSIPLSEPEAKIQGFSGKTPRRFNCFLAGYFSINKILPILI